MKSLFTRGRKLNIYLVFIIQSYFAVPKNIKVNSTQYFIRQIQNKQELLQIANNHFSDIHFNDVINHYKKCTAKPYFLLVNDTLASDNHLRSKSNLSEKI